MLVGGVGPRPVPRPLVREAQSARAALDERLKAAERSHAETLAQKDEAFAREKRGLKEKHKLETERLLEAQIKETQDLKERFDRARQLQEAQVDMLEKRLAELQQLYDSRPSRPEDLDRIAELQAELEQKIQEIKRLHEEMHFYKLELVNREQNYNKVFGASPTVGVLNPTQKKMAGPAPGSGQPPKMHVVQPPGAGMAGMNMGLPPLGMGGGVPPVAPGTRKSSMQKQPSGGNIRS